MISPDKHKRAFGFRFRFAVLASMASYDLDDEAEDSGLVESLCYKYRK